MPLDPPPLSPQCIRIFSTPSYFCLTNSDLPCFRWACYNHRVIISIILHILTTQKHFFSLGKGAPSVLYRDIYFKDCWHKVRSSFKCPLPPQKKLHTCLCWLRLVLVSTKNSTSQNYSSWTVNKQQESLANRPIILYGFSCIHLPPYPLSWSFVQVHDIMTNTKWLFSISLDFIFTAAGCKRTPKSGLIKMDIVKKVRNKQLKQLEWLCWSVVT